MRWSLKARLVGYLAAVHLIVEEAGGRFTDRHGLATHENPTAVSTTASSTPASSLFCLRRTADTADTAAPMIPTGAPVSVTMNENSAAIWMRGDATHYGVAVFWDVAASGGALSNCRYVPLGADISPAIYLPSTGKYYWANNGGTNCAPDEGWMSSMDPVAVEAGTLPCQ